MTATVPSHKTRLKQMQLSLIFVLVMATVNVGSTASPKHPVHGLQWPRLLRTNGEVT